MFNIRTSSLIKTVAYLMAATCVTVILSGLFAAAYAIVEVDPVMGIFAVAGILVSRWSYLVSRDLFRDAKQEREYEDNPPTPYIHHHE